MNKGRCCLCRRDGVQIAPASPNGPGYDCPLCGRFHADVEFIRMTDGDELTEETRAELTAATRQANETDPAVAAGRKQFLLTKNNYEVTARQHRSTVPERIDKLLALLAKWSRIPGTRADLPNELDYPLIDAHAASEMLAYVSFLEDSKLLKVTRTQTGVSCVLTIPGWQQAQPTLRSEIVANRCFVIMWFDDSMDSAYFDGIEPAIRECGYEARRIKEIEFNEGITDRVLAEIRQARFVIADFTGTRQNVYFEAGFAQGLGRDVIWCCNDSDKDKLHFDTRHLNHIVWTDSADLKQRLADRIRATNHR